jgi:hypothetical protein
VHGSNHDQFRHVIVGKFTLNESFGNNAGHLSPALHDGIRSYSHQTYVTAAINEPYSTLSEDATHLSRRVRIYGSKTTAGAAEYANAFHNLSL